MAGPPTGPGKTAPKLLDDFLNFDPLKANRSANLLADHPPPVGDGPQTSYQIGSCKHEYATKHVQSVQPPLDLRSDGTSKYKLAVVCKLCRIHATITIDYERSTNPCPNGDYPLHHFQRLPREDATSETEIWYAWLCSAPQCQAHLQVKYRRARLSDIDRDHMTNTERLKRRWEAVFEEDPGREGIRQATPMDTLSRLRKYIKDALNPSHARRAFPANNKRFQESFGMKGEESMDLLQRLGFKYAEADDLEWRLPDPLPIDDRLQADGNSLRELLEDVEHELLAMMSKLASETGAMNPATMEGWASANRDVERTLAAQGYQRYAPLRRANVPNDQLPYYASLGILPDFADSIIIFAFDRQQYCNPERQAYYFECLQVMAESRGSEELQMKSALLSSQDLVSQRDLRAAYRSLGLQTDNAAAASDDYVLNCFQSLQANSGTVIAEENREALYKIGTSRHSQTLINASKQSVEKYEDALAWLGPEATKDAPDDTILALAGAKSDSANDREITRKAVATIAHERKSNQLNNWLLGDKGYETEMGIDEALRLIGIDQKLDQIDPNVLETTLAMAGQDNPGDQRKKAIATIQKALTSGGAKGSTPLAQEDWPVGLKSLGNTCYLNSLLQYYFGMKPFRDIILNYDDYKLDLHEQKEKDYCVGGRIISAIEIKSGQRFAKDLQELFQRMIKTRLSAVQPERDLVCRAFLEAEKYAQLASDILGDDTTADAVEQHAAAKLPDELDTKSHMTNGVKEAEKPRRPSGASSVTLQADEDVVMVNEGDERPTANGNPPPTPPESPSQKAKPATEQPNHAPPLPPRIRRFSTADEKEAAGEKALKEAQKKATEQQDVTEVHDSATTRLRAGMKPTGVDKGSKEQQDKLRSVYSWGYDDTVMEPDGTTQEPTKVMKPDVQLNVPLEDTDLYALLDEVFDLGDAEYKHGHQSFKTITTLPSIVQMCIPRIYLDDNNQPTKSTKTVHLEDELYLDRYCVNEDIFPVRERCWRWRKQLKALRLEQRALRDADVKLELDSPDVVSETAGYLDSLSGIDEELADVGADGLDIDTELATGLRKTAELHRRRLEELEAEITKVQHVLKSDTSVFQRLKNVKYRLAAVFFHRGSTGGGHYWLDIRDFGANIWRKYNDETVSQIPTDKIHEITDAKEHNHGTPTYVVYVQDERKEELVQPVCREPVDGVDPPEETKDVQMMDAADMRPLPPGTANPKIIEDGGKASWDPKREVGDVNW